MEAKTDTIVPCREDQCSTDRKDLRSMIVQLKEKVDGLEGLVKKMDATTECKTLCYLHIMSQKIMTD